MKWVYRSDEAVGVREAGGKGAALGRLARAGLPVPAWFVVSPAAFEASGGTGRVEGEVAAAIDAAVRELPGEGLLAVRSSAVDEDGAAQSFAGQLESFLFVRPEDVCVRVADVWRSGFSERVQAYRREHGLGGAASAPAVLVQRMIDAEVSGVAFAADPIGGSRSTVVISALFGLGTALVGGGAEADTYRLRHDGQIVEQRIASKRVRHVRDAEAPEAVRSERVAEEQADRPALTEAQQRRVAELVLAVSRLEGRPQDIEWAIRGDELYLLQSRPITSMGDVADPEGVRALWDNSNIAESYNGITTPLTFSFAQRAYEGAYRQFCKLMKVPQQVIADNDAMFGQMLGLIRGRIYYNLYNWYRLLAMLPGFAVNQRFMEQMMGVREGLPAEVSGGIAQTTWAQRQKSRLRVGWSVAGLVWHHWRMERTIRAFYQRVDAALAPPAPPLERMRLDELTGAFRRLESQLLTRWDAPLINDFLAMIFFGALGKATQRWIGGDANLHNDLIGDEGGIISTEPVRRIAEMAAMALQEPGLVAALVEADAAEAVARLRGVAKLAERYDAYIEKFGDRCLEELKLESPTLRDDPTPLLRTIGQTALRMEQAGEGGMRAYRPREAAERQVEAALRGRTLRRAVFGWLLRNARARVRDRENLRFERTRLFGRARRIFVEAGRRLYAEGRLDGPRDVFYLTVDEVLGFVEGTSVDVDLAAVARRRREEFEKYRAMPAPADRFETRGAVYVGNRFTAEQAVAAEAGEDGVLRGVGCCPGVVRGRVRVIRDPRGAHVRQGEILVAERTDPGWIMLFPAAAGVLVERGSLLSHSAIVARELGIPAVVSVPNLMRTLTDGQVVEMDGATGVVRVVEEGTLNAQCPTLNVQGEG